jgi:hypothetical protein
MRILDHRMQSVWNFSLSHPFRLHAQCNHMIQRGKLNVLNDEKFDLLCSTRFQVIETSKRKFNKENCDFLQVMLFLWQAIILFLTSRDRNST